MWIVFIVLIGLGLASCDNSSPQSPPDTPASATKLDADTAPMGSCDAAEVESVSVGIPTVSAVDETAICRTMTHSLGNAPRINVFRAGLKAVSVIQFAGVWGDAPAVAYQLMNIVEARAITDPARIIDTFDTVTKIAEGTRGHVTPTDVDVMLRNSGEAGRKLSDDGLISMATVIWEEKKAQGL
jgi:hypothetical protein